MHRPLCKDSPDSAILQGKDPYEQAGAGAAEVSHEPCPVGGVGEVLGVDGDGHVVHGQDHDERYANCSC